MSLPKKKEGGVTMAIIYSKLFKLLNSKNLTSTLWLRQNGFYAATVDKLKKNKQVNTDTINKLCSVLHCQPGDIMEYVDDETANTE